MTRSERAVVEARMADMDCPLHWSGSEEDYRAAWGLPPAGDDSKGGVA